MPKINLIPPQDSLVIKIFGSFSIRTLLIVLFVVQIFTAVGLTGYFSFVNGQKAVDNLASQLQNEIVARIYQHLQAYLETPHLLNESHVHAARLGLLNLRDPLTTGHYFWQQLQVFQSVSTLYFGNEQGGIIVAGRQSDGTFYIEETKDFVKGDYYFYTTDAQGNREKLLKVSPPFDARVRPWYKAAVYAKKAVWSEPFFIYAKQNLGIAASLPVYDKIGQVTGVMTTQLVVSQINDFLRGLKIGRSGQTFIMERSGLMVASSTAESPFTVDEQTKEAKRLQAVESTMPLTRIATRYLLKQFGDLNQIDSNQQFNFEFGGERQYLQVAPLQDRRGLDWLIVVAVPEEDFMERIHANTRATIYLSLSALALATLIGILTSGWIVRPILRLTTAAKRISRGHWDETIPVERSDELGILAESFNKMVQQLQESFITLAAKNDEIRKLNEELEARVTKRTAELNTKIQELIQTRNELFQSEKMASLGRLVAGFAHEINTPIGVALGAASNLQEITQEIIGLFDHEEIQEDELVAQLQHLEEVAELTLSNLRRAIRLVGSFKRTAVDQTSEVNRSFNVRETIDDVNNSLHNKFKKTTIKIKIDCSESLTMDGLPGALDQILTNLMMNSFIHGFNEGQLSGEITIKAFVKDEHFYLEYADTGKGMDQETVEKVFEPFFTTRRGQGGSGLGMYICYNIIVTQLNGTITCESALGKGVKFLIEYPISSI